MNVSVEGGRIEDVEADAIIVNLFKGVTSPGGSTGAVDAALDGAITQLIQDGDLSGKALEVRAIYPRGVIPAKRVVIVGLGQSEEFDLVKAANASAAAVRHARSLGAKNVATIVHGAGIGGLDPAAAARATVEGARLGLYQYAAPRREADERRVDTLRVIESDEKKHASFAASAEVGQIVADGVTLARDLVNMPPNVATPSYMARVASDMAADHGLRVEIGNRDWAATHDMGAFLAVADGAGEPPRFIVLEHGAQRDEAPIIIAGKGITFDTGGISIKPSAGMERMKSDMAGAAAVLGAMHVLARLGVERRVIGLAPCSENMPDANAYRPADVITASNGKTIEIISTDAEGRMVLADALVYAQKFEPEAVIDLATLTGASVVALGRGVAASLFATEDDLRDRIVAAGETTAERVWPMPLWPVYDEAIKSSVADLKNSGGRMGGLGTSARFLHAFTDYPWAHVDMASMAMRSGNGPLGPDGATGYGVRLLVALVTGWSA